MIVCDERQKHKQREKKEKKKGIKYEWLAESKTSITRIHLLGHDMSEVKAGQRASGCHNTMSFDGTTQGSGQTTAIR